MNNETCPKCGETFPLVKTKGNEAECPKCGAVFESTQEVELSDEQSERVDQIHEAAYDFCKVLTEKEDLEWNMEYIGEVTDNVVCLMQELGYPIRYPGVVTEKDGSQYIEEIYPAKD